MHKVDVPNSVTYCNETPIIKWYVVKYGSKNGYQKDMSLKDIELCAQNLLIILCSIFNRIEGEPI